MVQVYPNRARCLTSTIGTGTVTLGAAVPRFQTFVQAGVVDTNAFRYLIDDGNDWEVGQGTYVAAGNQVQRSLIESSTGALLNLSGNAQIGIDFYNYDMAYPSYAFNALRAIPGGGQNFMLFMQTNAPTFWTKYTGYNDRILRIVTGAASYGGVQLFSTVFGRATTDNYTLAVGDNVAHGHSVNDTSNGHNVTHYHDYTGPPSGHAPSGGGIQSSGHCNDYGPVNTGTISVGHTHVTASTSTPNVGSSYPHAHNNELRVAYVDVIAATKD